MPTPQELPDGNISFPAIDLLPSTIVVEETQHDPTSDLAILVESMGKAHAQRLHSQNKLPTTPDTQTNSSSAQVAGGSDGTPKLNVGEYRKKFKEAIAMLKDPDLVRPNSELEREKKKQAKASRPPLVGVQKVYRAGPQRPSREAEFLLQRYYRRPFNTNTQGQIHISVLDGLQESGYARLEHS